MLEVTFASGDKDPLFSPLHVGSLIYMYILPRRSASLQHAYDRIFRVDINYRSTVLEVPDSFHIRYRYQCRMF